MREEVINCQKCGVPVWNNRAGNKKYCPDCSKITSAELRIMQRSKIRYISRYTPLTGRV